MKKEPFDSDPALTVVTLAALIAMLLIWASLGQLKQQVVALEQAAAAKCEGAAS